MSEACEDRDGRAGGATMLQPVILRLTLNAAAFAAARPGQNHPYQQPFLGVGYISWHSRDPRRAQTIRMPLRPGERAKERTRLAIKGRTALST